MSELNSAERRFAALARDKALSFFAANPTVRLAVGRFGASFRNGFGELDDNMPGGPCACLLTPLLLLRKASGLMGALSGLAYQHGVSEVFLSSLAFGWDAGAGDAPANVIGKAIREEIEEMRRSA